MSKPRGRPPTKCELIDKKSYGRKKTTTMNKARQTACTKRQSHKHTPYKCKLTYQGCKSVMKSKPLCNLTGYKTYHNPIFPGKSASPLQLLKMIKNGSKPKSSPQKMKTKTKKTCKK